MVSKPNKELGYYVYILTCSDSTLYTGITNDISKRLKKHNQGIGSRYTSARTPVELSFSEYCETKSEALKKEYLIKQLSRKEKLLLIEGKRITE